MRKYRPLLIEKLGLEMPGIAILGLRLNEHLAGARPEGHRHDFSQLLIYLRGEGAQTVEGQRFWAKAGSAVYVGAGELHHFERSTSRRPLCLVLDMQFESRGVPPRIRSLPAARLALVRRRVSDLLAFRSGGGLDRRLEIGSAILGIAAAALGEGGRRRDSRAVSHRAERLIREQLSEGVREPLAEVARRLGLQRDHLNRRLKGEVGLTLGQLRAQVVLQEAKRLLARGLPVGDAGARVGIDDQNYFARWFRGQTGLTPSAWRAGAGE